MFATAITAMVVFLIWLNGVAPIPVMATRAMNTAAGGVIALAAYWIWPTWERRQVSKPWRACWRRFDRISAPCVSAT